MLHKRAFRETSVLVDLFCRDEGRVRAVARGSRSKQGAKRWHLEPFTPLRVAWRGKGGLKTLVRAEPAGQAKASLLGQTLYIGLYINELLMRLLAENDAHEHLYRHYAELLNALPDLNVSSGNHFEPLLRVFELSLLEEIGYALPLDMDSATGAPVEEETWYRLMQGEGLVSVASYDVSTRHELFSGAHLLAMAANNYQDSEVKKSAKRLLRLALANQLGGKPLRSREFFESYAKASIDQKTTPEPGL